MASSGSVIVAVLQTFSLVVLLYGLTKLIGFILNVKKLTKSLKHVPGPPEKHWLYGSFANFPKDLHSRLIHFVTICNQYGQKGYLLIWGPFWKPILIVCSPRMMGQICKSSEPKADGFVGGYRMIKPWLGEGLLVANGKKWARNRRLLTPAFHFDILKPYMQVYNKAAGTLVSKIGVFADQGVKFEAFQQVCPCTLEIILKCAFSYQEDVQSQRDSNPYVMAVNRITDSFTLRFMRPYLLFDFLWNMSSVGRQFNKDCDYVHKVAEEIIERRRKTLEKDGVNPNSRYIDFLDILLTAKDENNQGLSPLEIRNEVDTFLFEGHDTTASALSWILYALATHPEIQTKCQEEIDEVLQGRDSDDITWSDLSKLDYLTMCIKEGMRLYSPVPIVSRETTKPFDVGEHVLPVGSMIQLNMWALHHKEDVWGPDHMQFVPERFSKENVSKMEPFQYAPFSAGSRNCIGQNFAMNEEKVVLSKVLSSFTLTAASDHEVKPYVSAVMRATNGILLNAKRRLAAESSK